MARDGSGIYSAPAGTTATAGTTIESAKYNAFVNDLVTDANTPRPIVAGGTGASTAGAALTALGAQASSAALTSIAALTTAANKGIYTTASNTYATFDLTAAGRALLDDADAAAQRATLGAQASLGFTPVEQGGGSGMGTNKVYIGYQGTDALLLAQVDATSVGGLVRRVASTVLGGPSEMIAPGSTPIFAARAWVNFNGQGTIASRASGNVSSLTDNGTGDYTVNFTTALSDANYAVVGTTSTISGALGIVSSATNVTDFNKATTSVRVCTYNQNAVLVDFPSVNVVIFR